MSNLKQNAPSLSDTPPEIEAIQVALFRQASVAKRIRLLRSLSQTTIQLSRRAMRAAIAGAEEKEIPLAFVALNYGAALAAQLRTRWSFPGVEEIAVSPPDILSALEPVIDAFEQ